MTMILLISNSTLNSLCQYSFSFVKANSPFDLFADMFSKLSSKSIAFSLFSNHFSSAKYWKLGDFFASDYRPVVFFFFFFFLWKSPYTYGKRKEEQHAHAIPSAALQQEYGLVPECPYRIRVVEVRRDLWRSSGPTSFLKQGHLVQVSQDHDQTAFVYLHECSISTTSLDNLWQCSVALRVNVQRKPPAFLSVPLACPWEPLKSLALSSLHLPFKYLWTLMRFPIGTPRLNNPSSLSLSLQEGCSSPFIVFVALMCVYN